jgi:N-acetylglutamate synthase-like GNAT family acetyltransferase
MSTPEPAPRLLARPLKVWERGALAAALAKAGLGFADLKSPHHLFWRYETSDDDIPVGFGGLEIYEDDALLRSVLTLPPMRNRGIGTRIVALLESEAMLRRCRSIWILTKTATGFFGRLGYAACHRAVVPEAIRGTEEFLTLCSQDAGVMVKRF